MFVPKDCEVEVGYAWRDDPVAVPVRAEAVVGRLDTDSRNEPDAFALSTSSDGIVLGTSKWRDCLGSSLAGVKPSLAFEGCDNNPVRAIFFAFRISLSLAISKSIWSLMGFH